MLTKVSFSTAHNYNHLNLQITCNQIKATEQV